MINKVIILGNLGQDPEVTTLENGNKVAKFSVATSETYKDKQGEKQTQTEWHNVEIWGNLATVAENYLKKGSKVYLEGKIKTDTWEKDGETKYKTKISAFVLKMLDCKPQETTQSNENLDALRGVAKGTGDLPF